MRGKAKQAYDGIEEVLQAVYDWQAKADALVTTGPHDSEIIATHDSRGRLIEMWVRPGLQRELTTEEFEDRINSAIEDNAIRAQAQLREISDEFLARFAEIPGHLTQQPTGLHLVQSLDRVAEHEGKGSSH